MRSVLIFFILIVISDSRAQVWFWAASSSGLYGDFGYSICHVNSGEVGVCGAFTSTNMAFGTSTLNNAGNRDAFLVKYDANANVLWVKSIGGVGTDHAFSVGNDKVGNFYVTGTYDSPSLSFGTHTLINSGSDDGFLAKYDPNGNVLWVKNIGGIGSDQSRSISVDTLGNAYVTGGYDSGLLVLGSFTLTQGGLRDLFVAKFDPNGTVLWAVKASGIYEEYGSSISIDEVGNAYVTGRCMSPSLTTGSISHFITQGGFFLIKYDQNGMAQWIQSGSSTQNEGTAYTVSADKNGGIYVAGNIYGTLTIGSYILGVSGTMSTFIAKYSGDGNVTWAKRSIGPYSFGFGLSANKTGVYLSGSAQFPISFNGVTLYDPPNSYYSMYIVRFDSNGNLICATGLKNAIADGMGLSTDNDNNLYMTSNYLGGPMVMGTHTLIPNNGNTVFVAKYACSCNVPGLSVETSDTLICAGASVTLTANGASSYSWTNGAVTATTVVSPTVTTTYTIFGINTIGCKGMVGVIQSVSECVGIPINNLRHFSIYPNPSYGVFKIYTENAEENLQILLYDLLGRKVHEQFLTSNTIDLQPKPATGLYNYILRRSDNIVANGKLVILE